MSSAIDRGYKNTKKRKKRQVLIGKDFAIDEDDSLVVSEILSSQWVSIEGDQIERQALKLVEIRENDEERRVYKLRLTEDDDDYYSDIRWLPPSIGKLQNLVELDLSRPKLLKELPEEIGDLVSLNKMNLSNAGITSLPPSIGRLQNLVKLDLSYTKNLFQLPEEIGDLINLNELKLGFSKITSLPSSIGQLKNLKYLNLAWTRNLSELPDEIGDLASLSILRLWGSGIMSLPDSIGRLPGLIYLGLSSTFISELVSNEFMLMLVQNCRSLGSLGIQIEEGRKKVSYALACNRARSRTGFETKDKNSIQIAPKLWPLILKYATRAFIQYSHIDFRHIPWADHQHWIK